MNRAYIESQLTASRAAISLVRAFATTLSSGAVTEGKCRQAFEELTSFYGSASDLIQYQIITRVADLRTHMSRPLLRRALTESSSALIRHEAAFGLGILSDTTDESLLVT